MAIASALSFSTSFNFATAIAKFNFEDTTDYSAEGISLSDLKGNFKIVNPLGVVVYENTSWINPDIDGSVSLEFNSITIPERINGYWTVTYTIQVSGGVQAGTYSKEVQYNFKYTSPIVAIYQEGNPYTELFKSVDQTNYTVEEVVPTITRVHTVIYPELSGLPNIVLPSSYIGVGFPNFSVGVWNTTVETTLEYQYSNFTIQDKVSGSKQLNVEPAPNIVDVLCCINKIYVDIQNAENTSLEAPLKQKFEYASSLLNAAVQSINYGQYNKAQTYIDEIYNTTGCTPNCNCGGELVRSVQYTGTSSPSGSYEGVAPINISGGYISLDFNGVENNYLRQSTNTSVIGRAQNSVGNVADIAASADEQFLVRRGGLLQFDELLSTDITDALGYTPYSDTNPDGFISGNQTITVSGEASGTGATAIALTLDNDAVIEKTLTDFTQTTGTITSADSLLSAIEKLDGNLAALEASSVVDDLAALSVLGRSANTSGVMGAITANSNYQILRRNGATISFGAIDLSQSGAVGSSILGVTNGGTGRGTATLQGTVWFAGALGILDDDNSNFYYDKTTKSLLLGTTTPSERFIVKGTIGLGLDTKIMIDTDATSGYDSGFVWKEGSGKSILFGGFSSTFGLSSTEELSIATNSITRAFIYKTGELFLTPDNQTRPISALYDIYALKDTTLTAMLESVSGSVSLEAKTSGATGDISTIYANGALGSWMGMRNLRMYYDNAALPELRAISATGSPSPNVLLISNASNGTTEEGVRVYSDGNVQLMNGFAVNSWHYHNVAGAYIFGTTSTKKYGVVLGPSASATLTVTLPTTPQDGQEIVVATERDITSLSFSSTKAIYGHNGGTAIPMTITGGAAKGAGMVMTKYVSAGNGGAGAWYVTVSE